MAFTEANIKDIWNLFNLPRHELQPGSNLRVAITEAERHDTLYGTTIVADVQALINEAKFLGGEVKEAQAKVAIEEIEEKDVYRIRYDDKTNPSMVPISQRSQKLEQISRLLELDRYLQGTTYQYARVIGINDGANYRGY